MFKHLLARIAAVGILALGGTTVGCDSSSAPTAPPPAPGTITVWMNATGTTVVDSGQRTATLTVVRGGGFTGVVNLTVTGAPPGVTAVLSNVQTVSARTTATLIVSVDAGTVRGVYPLIVHVTGTGVAEATTNYSVTVAGPHEPAYALNYGGPSALTLLKASVTFTTVVVYRTDFTGNVVLTVENLPAGVTAQFATNPVTGSSSLLTLTAADNAPLGTFSNVLVRGVAPGLADRTLPLSLRVTELGFSLSLTAPELTIAKGGSQPTTVNIVRTSYTGTVQFYLSDLEDALPQGVTAAFAPSGATSGNSSVLTLAVGSAATPGVYELYVWGTGLDGYFAALLTLTITATNPGNDALTTTQTGSQQ